jgi:hypothetical protein
MGDLWDWLVSIASRSSHGTTWFDQRNSRTSVVNRTNPDHDSEPRDGWVHFIHCRSQKIKYRRNVQELAKRMQRTWLVAAMYCYKATR